MNQALKSEDSEKAVIGSLIHNGPKILQICLSKGMEKEWFTSPERKAFFEMIMEMRKKDKVLDFSSICDYARGMEKADDIQTCIMNCEDASVVDSYVEYYVEMMMQKHKKRTMKDKLKKTSERLNTNDEFETILVDHEQDISELHLEEEEEMSIVDRSLKLTKGFKLAKKNGFISIPSRWNAVQRKTSGYRKGKVTIMGARPGTGKSTFMCNEVVNCCQQGFKAGVLSLEMETDEIVTKIICDMERMKQFKFLTGDATDKEMERFEKRAVELESWKLWIRDDNMTEIDISNWIKRMKRLHDIDIVFIDYLQLISASGRVKGNRHEVVNSISKEIAHVAKKTNVAVVALAQLKRLQMPPNAKPEEKWKFVPRLEDLKESGSLEEDAYQAFLLYPTPSESDPDELDNVKYTLDVAKHRNGPTGEVYLKFDKPHGRFEEDGKR